MRKPFFWHQGLFLQPQHFQEQDRYIQSLLEPFNTSLQPHFWGAAGCRIQEAALGNQSVQVLQGTFHFPDNTAVSFPGNSLLEARSFSESWLDGGKPLGVMVGLKKWNPAGENVTVLANLENMGEVTTRFVTCTDPEKIADLYQNGPAADVKYLYYALRLFFDSEEEKLGDYDLIPLASVERSGETIILSPRYYPPVLSISASVPLLQLIVEIRDQLASRSHQLEAYKRERGIHTAEFGARDMVFLLALRSLNRYIPLLFQMTESEPVHPWQVYGLLRQIIGELSTFSESYNVLGENAAGVALIPPYNHRKLWKCFSAAQSVLAQLLEEITAGPEYMLQLLFDGTYYTTDLLPTIFQGNNSYYLVIDSGEDKQQLASFMSLAKMGARESLPILIARALPGVGLQPLDTPPQELPRRATSSYFKIDHHSDQWRQVERNRNLAVFWDAAPENLKVELMVVGRS